MKEGREPMRSFSDLAQFLGTTTVEPEPPKKSKKRKGDRSGTDKPRESNEEAVPPSKASPLAEETSQSSTETGSHPPEPLAETHELDQSNDNHPNDSSKPDESPGTES